ncbi:MAG: hypothetical protein O2931_06530 [Planctomycetota bacterium]|nr:hypothetical protein [Planctomycetota bacterium]MDA1178435.1 hypothetical protein [Planctomycetota bacterium]
MSPTGFTVNTVGDSAQIDLRSNLFVSANSLTSFSPEDSFGSYLANFGFSPLPGSIITGYEITFSGIYNIERPGSVAVAGPSTFHYSQTVGAFNAPWSHSQTFMETPIPALSGTTQASAYVDLIDIPGVIVGYEQMPDPSDLDCVGGFDDGFCQLIDDLSRPIYNPPPRTETDFGDANLVINTMTITARTVPEPNHLGFVVIMLAANGWMARRRST